MRAHSIIKVNYERKVGNMTIENYEEHVNKLFQLLRESGL